MDDIEFSKSLKNFVKNSKSIKYLFLAAILVLFIPFFYRFFYFENILIGEYPYYHIAKANEFSLNNNFVDTVINPYDVLLHYSSKIIDIKTVSFFLPIILGIFSLILFLRILKQNRASPELVNTSLFLTMTSPLFIYLFTQSNQFSLVIFLNLFAISLIHKKRFVWLSSFIYLLISFFGATVLFVSLIFLWAYTSFISKEKRFFIVSGVMLTSFIIQKFLPFSFGIVNYAVENTFAELVSDMGGVFGIGIMHLALFLFGFVIFWMDKNSNYFTKIVFLIMFASVFFVDYSILIIYNFVIYLLGAMAIISLQKRKWYSRDLKKITILIIICGLLFSSLSYVNRLNESEPNPKQIESLNWMKNNLMSGKVLSKEEFGFLINSETKFPVFNTLFTKEDSLIKFDEKNMFFSRQLNVTQDLLFRNNISYIWITEAMRKGELWNDDEQGLLFLLRNDKTFQQVYNDPGNVEVWEVKWVTRRFKIIDKSNESLDVLLLENPN
jgi:hypothetical protein